MKVKVVLTTTVEGLGKEKSIVSVSRGYALNYLIPKGFAKLVDEDTADSALKFEKSIEEQKKNNAIKEKELLESKVLAFKLKAGEGDKLFGSITSQDISQMLKRVFGLDIDKKKIKLDSPLKKVGDYFIPVKLYKEIEAILNIRVEKE